MSEPGTENPVDPMPDRCPYQRPFPEGFADCPTFQPQQFVAATTQEQPLSVHLSCVHLRVGEHGRNRFYAQCAIGTAADRRAWLQQVGARRVELMRQLQAEFEHVYGRTVQELTAAKAATIARPDDEEASAHLEELLNDLAATLNTFMSERARLLEEAGFPVASLEALVAGALERWRESPRLGTPPVDSERLEDFAPELRSFLGGSPREEQEAKAR